VITKEEEEEEEEVEEEEDDDDDDDDDDDGMGDCGAEGETCNRSLLEEYITGYWRVWLWG